LLEEEKEAMRVIKRIPMDFLPEYKNGIPVNSEITLPVRFILN
jgi:hypothetical protein